MTATLDDVTTTAAPPSAPDLPTPRPAPEPAATGAHLPSTAAGHGPAYVRLTASGELDRPAGQRLVAQVQDAAGQGAARVVVDLSQVPAMHGEVARDLMWQEWRLAHDGGSLRLARPARNVQRVLRWYGAGYLVLR